MEDAWKTKDLNVELHYQLLPESRSAYSTVFADGWSVAERAEGYRWRQQIEDDMGISQASSADGF